MFRNSVPIALFAMCIVGCSSGKSPFLLAQVCLKDDTGVEEFKETMRKLSFLERAKYVDRSDETTREMRTIRDSAPVNGPKKIINLGLVRDDGLSVVVSNLGLSDHEVALGFIGGDDPAEAQRLASSVTSYLSRDWVVRKVPAGTGALPSSDCM